MITTNIQDVYLMQDNIYTVDQVAAMLNLHPKTIRRFIQEGKLKASKVGGQWRITENDLDEVMNGQSIPADIDTNNMESLNDAGSGSDGGHAGRVQVSTVIDIYVKDAEEAMRLSNTVIAVMNCKDPEYGYARYNHIYFKNEGKARFIFWGQPLFISHILLTFSELVK